MAVRASHVWTCLLLVCLIYGMEGKNTDTQVTCLFFENCILPCSFRPLGGEVVHWFRQDLLVYSQPLNTSEIDQNLLGRTSVSSEQIALGNASLVLQHCGSKDRGRYKCRVSRGQELNDSFVILKVEAPIRSVSLEVTRLSGYEEIKCSTQDIYPAPQVSWSTEPPTPTERLKSTTRKMADKQGLYAVVSKLKKLKDYYNLTYLCTINSFYSTQSWTTSLTQTVLNNVMLTSKSDLSSTWKELNFVRGQDLVLPCVAPWNLENFTLTWSFTIANSAKEICTYNSEDRKQIVSDKWEGRVMLDPNTLLMRDGSLRLIAPLSQEDSGTYTCTFLAQQRKHVAKMWVNVTLTPAEVVSGEQLRQTSATVWWISAVVLAVVAIIAAVVVGIMQLKADWTQSSKANEARNGDHVRVAVTDSEVVSEGSHLTEDPSDGHT